MPEKPRMICWVCRKELLPPVAWLLVKKGFPAQRAHPECVKTAVKNSKNPDTHFCTGGLEGFGFIKDA